MLGTGGARNLKNHHMTLSNYVNFDIDDCHLIEYKHSAASFDLVEDSNINYQYISNSKNPLVLNTPTYLYLWLPEGYWAEQLKAKQELALVISEVTIKFIAQYLRM